MPYLPLARFRDIALIRRFDLRPNLLSGLVEWWCTETHIFIMPCGECTITLEDVFMQLELRVDGAVVTGRSKVWEPSVVCHRLLGRSLDDEEQNFTCLKLTWLRANFKELSSTATDYNWGSAMLASLYYELCRATKYGVSNMAGCLVPPHSYRRRNQLMGELEDQHMAEPNSEDQALNTSDQWVNAFCDESQSSLYHSNIGGSSSYHPDVGDSSSYHPDISDSSSFH
ncbi:hypothetical protein J1N35_038570 [Gossypium stocksii]|uniref:Aminotransferase-like plant mobile domain-containing protein n=1 Tax=Gossypium stocksii TaxID=47602 RepID=A0A9D3UM31_9ROSI|nr:hypothetical protein J1N35_038570 [Gossypium stocksii]